MTSTNPAEDAFDHLAAAELLHLEKSLGDIDPDELEVEMSQGVLTCVLADGQKIIINSHHAARQIWMAAFREAWHFSPVTAGDNTEWRTSKDELRTTLSRLLSDRLKRPLTV